MTPDISVIIPAFNEASRLATSLRTILGYLRNHGTTELILVDDGSHDGTSEVALESIRGLSPDRARVIRCPVNRGKGSAVRAGLLAARAPIALFTDADLSTPITEIPKITESIARGECDLAFGSRAVDRSLIGVHQPWRREMGGRIFNLAVRAATGLPFWDTQCGFKAFRMSVCRPIIAAATVDRFGFDVELLFVAYRAGLRLSEIPVRWDHCDGSKVSVGRDAVRMLAEIRQIRVQAARGVYARAIREASATAVREERHLSVAFAR